MNNVRFSNRPFGVKHFQAIHRCHVDVTHGLALLFGIGTRAVPSSMTRLYFLRSAGTLYILDEPTTGLHPSDVDKLVKQLNGLVEGGNTVVVVEHDMALVAQSDWVIDMGAGAGEGGGTVVAFGVPSVIASASRSMSAPYLKRVLEDQTS